MVIAYYSMNWAIERYDILHLLEIWECGGAGLGEGDEGEDKEGRMLLTGNRNEYLNSKPGRAEFAEEAE